MKKYQCIACGTVKDCEKSCMCPICGYMMFPQPYDRSEVIIGEIRRFVEKIVAQKIEVQSLSFGKLKEDMHRFPSFSKIKTYVSKAEKTEIFYHRLKTSIEQMQQYFHETFRKHYSSKNDTLDTLSDHTSALLQNVLLKLDIEIQWKKAVFSTVTVQYTEVPHQDYIHLADQLLERIFQLADKMNQFIRANNIYGCAYNQETEPPKMQKNHTEINWQEVLSKHISACDSILKKKYVIDIFEDGSTELTAMLKVAWDAIFVLLSAPIKKTELIYTFDNDKIHEELSAELCNKRLMKIFAAPFHAVIELVQAENFLKDQSEEQLFELYQNMLDLDKHHYMSGKKGNFKIGKWEKKLNALIGLDAVKSNVRKIKAYALANKDHDQPNLHMCFLGNPGTGKTEVARIIAGILHENGLLQTNKVVETDRSGLVAGYVGQTALKTAAVIEEAMGGVLFIDEAYSLVQGDSSNDYGHEAVSTLIKAMEDHRGEFCVILAGYQNQMTKMLASNPGFPSRIQFTLNFPNYNRDELGQIATMMLKNKGYGISDEAKDRILAITDHIRKEPNFANAREMRNIIEQVVMCQNVRCAGTEDKMIELADVNAYIRENHIYVPTSGEGIVKKILTAEEELEQLVGLRSVKRMIKKIKAYAKRNKNDSDMNLHMCFCGNPGTGKTEVARILSRILYEAGVLPEAKLTETDAQGLISKYVGGTASKTLAKINDAMGGILFIDEAYSLIRSDDDNAATYGEEAIAVLLKQMEDQRGQFCVILAGYPSEMEELIRVNPGLASRVQFTLHFQDYTREELEEIALHFLKRKGYEMDSSAMQLLLDITEYYRTKSNFANARTVRNILEQVIMNQNLREDEENHKDNLLMLSDVQDYLDDENIDLNRASARLNKIGF